MFRMFMMSIAVLICDILSVSWHSWWWKDRHFSEMYLVICQTSKTELFAKIIRGFQRLTIFEETFILNTPLFLTKFSCNDGKIAWNILKFWSFLIIFFNWYGNNSQRPCTYTYQNINKDAYIILTTDAKNFCRKFFYENVFEGP